MQRRRRANWLKYDQAARIAREAGCTSRKSYWDWHAAKRPNNIPKMPQRVYKEWTTWGEFLETQNVFQKYEKGSYRPFWEAVRWAQKECKEKHLTRSIDWLHYYDENEANIPPDIPKNAHYHYKEMWQGWSVWLGTGIESKVEAAKVQLGVFALCRQSWTPPNVLRVVMANDGPEQLKAIMRDDELGLVKAYQFEPELAETLQSILGACGSAQPDGTYIIRDMNSLLFEFSSLLIEVV